MPCLYTALYRTTTAQTVPTEGNKGADSAGGNNQDIFEFFYTVLINQIKNNRLRGVFLVNRSTTD